MDLPFNILLVLFSLNVVGKVIRLVRGPHVLQPMLSQCWEPLWPVVEVNGKNPRHLLYIGLRGFQTGDSTEVRERRVAYLVNTVVSVVVSVENQAALSKVVNVPSVVALVTVVLVFLEHVRNYALMDYENILLGIAAYSKLVHRCVLRMHARYRVQHNVVVNVHGVPRQEFHTG